MNILISFACVDHSPKIYSIQVLNEFPHDPKAFIEVTLSWAVSLLHKRATESLIWSSRSSFEMFYLLAPFGIAIQVGMAENFEFFLFKINFFMFLNYFNVLILKN
jgi:hypothetical protein